MLIGKLYSEILYRNMIISNLNLNFDYFNVEFLVGSFLKERLLEKFSNILGGEGDSYHKVTSRLC